MFALILIVGRFLLLCSLYMLQTPAGQSLVPDWNRFIWHTLYAESGFCMALAFFFFVFTLWIPQRKMRWIKIVSAICASLYLFLSGVDDELQRWMSQKLSLSFIKTYTFAFTDGGLVGKIALGGLGHFLLTLGIVVSTIALISFFLYKVDLSQIRHRPIQKSVWMSLGFIFVLAVLGCTSHLWYHYSPRRWDRIRPVVYSLVSDLFESVDLKEKPKDFQEGVVILGGDPDKDYPFWHEKKDEQKSLDLFKQKPLSDKPNIILFTIESLRGWTSDMRVESNCKRFPNLCRLSQKSLYFPNTYSIGNPSVEGLLGIMTGVMSLPSNTLLRDFPNTRLKSFSEILSEAGYYTEVLLGADPRFDNEEPWYRKWFDYYEFDPKNADDVSSALRFVERYRQRPKDRPVFFHWMSLSMHTPYILPSKMGETPKDPGQAYLRATAYMDSALGIILDSLENEILSQKTLLILTGDHSSPNGKQQQDAARIGLGSEGYSWISLMFCGPGIIPRIDSRIVSQQNIAPSILGYLGLDVSNHFMGINLFAGSLDSIELPQIYSFKYGSMAMRKDSLAYYIHPVNGTEPAIVQKILLSPTWNTNDPSDGFTTGEIVETPIEKRKEIARKMRAAANAWNYIVYSNRIMPPEK